MKYLILPEGVGYDPSSALQDIQKALKKAQSLFEKIKSFRDVELHLLKGQGLARTTYKVYLSAVRQLYEFTEGLNPLQVTPNVIEDFYDDLEKRVDRITSYNKVQALKRLISPRWIAAQSSAAADTVASGFSALPSRRAIPCLSATAYQSPPPGPVMWN